VEATADRKKLGGSRIPEKVQIGDQNATIRVRPHSRAPEATERGPEMDDDDFELIHGSGNVFRDLSVPNADREHLQSVLAARIIGVLNDQKLTLRAAHELTGFAAADFSRIRRVKLGRFTIDRLMSILDALGQDVEVTVTVRPRPAPSKPSPTARPSEPR
jgi:predicted XRE-type DNA-binding protein